MAVLPDRMNPYNGDTAHDLMTIREYIEYMAEHIDMAFGNIQTGKVMTRTNAAAEKARMGEVAEMSRQVHALERRVAELERGGK